MRSLVFVFVFAAAPFVLADEGRYQDYAIGARALGLGGAFTAIADDGSGVFYNPAGIVDTARAKFSISTSLYGLEFAGEGPVERLQQGVSAADLIIIPSATGYVAGLGDPLPNGAFRHAWGFGTQVPQYQSRFVEAEERGDDGSVTRFRSTTQDRTLHAGVAYGIRAGPWLRVGFAGHYVLRTLAADEALTAIGADGVSFLTSEARIRTSIHSLRLSAGLKVWPGPRWRLGLNVMTPSLSLYRDGSFRAISIDGRNGTPEISDTGEIELSGVDFTSVIPLVVRAGLAFIERGDYALAADAVYYGESAYELVPLSAVPGSEKIPIPLDIRRGDVVNVAIGGEKQLGESLSIAGGLFTNFSAAPEPLADASNFLIPGSSRLSRVHMVGASIAIGMHAEHVNSRLGITGSYGAGPGVRPSPVDARFESGAPPLVVVNEQQAFVYVFWSSSFQHGEGGGHRPFDL